MKFEAVVIGAGPGGYVAAIRLAQLGVRTAIVERGPLGGVCLNWGCIPSKAYITAAKIHHGITSAGDIGINVSEPEVDLARMKEWKDSIVNRLTGGVKALLEKAGVTILSGAATFTGANKLTVNGDKTETVEFGQCMIATGSRSVEIPTFKYDGENVISSTHALDLTEIQKDMVVIGGGVIGLEIGMYLDRFGTNVTVVEMLDQVLPGVDAEVVKQLTRNLKKRKIKVYTGSKALGYTGKKGKLTVQIEDPKGKKVDVKADKILVAVGRRPNTENLGCAAGGIELDERGFVKVNEQLRTSNPNVFAIGDVAGGMLLAHKASKEGLVAASIIAGATNEVYDVRAMPWAIFTDPEVAGVGMTEEEAKAAGHEVRVGKFPFTALGRALAMRETDGFVKLVADAKTDLVLGATIIGHDASDLIAEVTLGIEMGATAEDIGLTVHAHPTLTESLMEAAEAVHGKAVHIFNP